MRKLMLTTSILFITLILAFGQNFSDNDNDPEIGVVEHLGDYFPEGVQLITENLDTVDLLSLVDKPTIINFVYYRCPGICSPLMGGIAEVADKSDLVLGEDYQILTISFDPSETIDLGTRKKASYFSLMNKKDQAEKGWLFFTSDSASIAKGTNATGFKYKKTGNDFLHAASVVILAPDGKIVRYLNGIYFLPFEWKMALIEAARGQIGPSINKVLQFCYSYDPVGQTYMLNITRVFGVMMIFLAVIFLIILIVKSKKKKQPLNT
ncbi:SCO family protein [Roseimarinus sediminis]|uniref:SCO family protein n=1 Tax=Roseimarinus sediminis TaxID=1610899 RepID=UPI003D2193AC